MKHLPLPDDGESTWKDVAPFLDQALDDLPEKDRQVIFLKYFDGLSFEQIARQFGGEPAAWRQRGSRAVERLRLSLTKRGITVSSAALGSGLGTSLAQTAPPAVAASLGATPAAAAALSWKTLTLHSIHLMKIKPAAVIAAVLLLSLAPLGMQAMAISDARQRIASLVNHGSVASSDSSARQASASDRAAMPVNLVALADALLAAKEGDLVKRFTTEKKVAAMSADELERLLTESTNLELGPEQRNALVQALFRQFCRVAEKTGMPCERVMSLLMRLAQSMKTGQGTLWNFAGKNVDRWVDQNPDAAVAWYRKMGKTSAAEDSSILIARAFDGLHRRSRDEAVAFFRSLGDEEKQAVFGGGGGFQNPDLMLDLISEIGDARLRSTSVNVFFHNAEGRSPQEVRGWIDKIQPSSNEAAQLLAIAVSGIGGEKSLAEISRRIDWMREAGEGLDVSYATGIYLSNIGASSLATVRQALDAEWERHPDERMLASYISRCMFNQDLILDAIPRSQLITDQDLRDSALRMMLLSARSREDARGLARKGGMDEKEVDRLIPREP